jgi:hypothetical protein
MPLATQDGADGCILHIHTFDPPFARPSIPIYICESLQCQASAAFIVDYHILSPSPLGFASDIMAPRTTQSED